MSVSRFINIHKLRRHMIHNYCYYTISVFVKVFKVLVNNGEITLCFPKRLITWLSSHWHQKHKHCMGSKRSRSTISWAWWEINISALTRHCGDIQKIPHICPAIPVGGVGMGVCVDANDWCIKHCIYPLISF